MDPMLQGQLKEWFVVVGTFGLFGLAAFLSAGALRRAQKNEMQKHMLEKFSSAQDFAEFVQSPAGQKYVMSFSESVTDSRDTILNSLRTGIILFFIGAGFDATGFRMGEIRSWMEAVGSVLMMTGTGFVVAAIVARLVAKRMKTGEKE
jgi:hypothetical protein